MLDRSDEETQAWQRYLDATRGLNDISYEEVEPWAWKKLSKKLLTIHKRRAKVAS